ncbi:MAG: hypothetical protein QRY74_01590 [Chlamydia sp.]
MTASVTLSSLCYAIELYSKSKVTHTSFSSWRDFPWLYNRFSLIEKMYGSIGFFRFQTVRERTLVPHILLSALPYIERYQAGNWRRQDEERLHEVVRFAVEIIRDESQYKKKFLSLVAPELRLFLVQGGSLNSFASEKEKTLQRLCEVEVNENPKNRLRSAWSRYETFSQYISRMKNLILEIESQEAHKEVQERSCRLAYRAVELPAKKTKSAVFNDTQLESLHSSYIQKLRLLESGLNELVQKGSSTQEFIRKELKKSAIRFRLEPFSILQETLNLEEDTLSFLIQVERFLALIAEYMGRRYSSVDAIEEAFDMIHILEKNLVSLPSQEVDLLHQARDLQQKVESATKKIDEKLHTFFKMFDSQPLLPIGSILRAQQLKMMKMAREKLKQYRLLAMPTVAFHELEQHISSIYNMVIAFYSEGIEIENSRKQFKKLIVDATAVEIEKRDSSYKNFELQRVLEEAIQIEKNLEMIADRKEQFQKVSAELIAASNKSII